MLDATQDAWQGVMAKSAMVLYGGKLGPGGAHRRTEHFPSGNRHSISNAYHSASRVIFARPLPIHPRISCQNEEVLHLHSAPDRNVSDEGGGPEAPTAGSGSKHHQRTVVGSCISGAVPKVVAVLDIKSSPKMDWFLFAFCITPVLRRHSPSTPPASPSKHTRHPLFDLKQGRCILFPGQ